MAAARSYATASYDPLRLSRLLFTRPAVGVPLMILLAIVIALVVYTTHGVMPTDTLRLFDFIPAAAIHDLGVGAMALVALSGLAGAINMVRHVRKEDARWRMPRGRLDWLGALWETLGWEVLAQRRYREDCRTTTDERPWFLQRWFVHGTILWGFLGLLAATALDYGLALLGMRPIGTWVPLWYPVRLLGTVAGLFLVYGTSLAIFNRLRKADVTTAHSSSSDWAFLILLWVAGTTGFALEVAVYLPHPPTWAYWMLLAHIAVAVELILLAPFTKFAHAMYRTMAVYLHALKPLPVAERTEAGAH
jgi:hypothetical protein